MIGQSNMAGRGPLDAVPPIEHPLIFMFREGSWMIAREPLHTDKPAIAGIGPGMSFAVAVLEQKPEAQVGLVPCAVGGTPLKRWMPGADLFNNAVAVARQACAGGTLKGILWHQGENDSAREEDTRNYGQRLEEMIPALRAALGCPEVPFIAGELGAFLARYTPPRPLYESVNRQLRLLEGRVSRYACVSSEWLQDKGDNLHFDSASLRELGRRYARAWLSS